VALTPKGRELYDSLLAQAGTGKDNLTHQLHLQEIFSAFPDSEMSCAVRSWLISATV
jgi:uncharacterized glyoxalase superfamily metalloenzyme YdcJ